jgi:carnitine 3-dehydrogenase
MVLSPNLATRVGLVGLGTVGLGWAANYLAKGFDVVATDVSPHVEAGAHTFLRDAWPSLVALNLTSVEHYPAHRLTIVPSINDAVCEAHIVHENTPEQLDLKWQVLADIEAAAAPGAIIASSSGGIPPSPLQKQMRNPERFVIVHPFNPPHLIPLVEVLGGEKTDPSAIDWVMIFMRKIGKHPIRLNREMTGYLTNRLQFALLREAINCLAEGVASPQSIEDAVRYGLAPRWLVMGSLTTLTLAGGPKGMQQVLDNFSGAIDSWWADLGKPLMTPEIKKSLLVAAEEITEGRTIADWISWRDENLVTTIKTLNEIDRAKTSNNI